MTTKQDWLAEIEEQAANFEIPDWRIDWLIGEVRRLRGELMAIRDHWRQSAQEMRRIARDALDKA